MERVGKYGLYVKRMSPKDFDVTKEAVEQINNMLVFLADKMMTKALILLGDKKTLKHDALFWLLRDVPGELGKHGKDYVDSALYGNKELVFPTKRTENLMRKKTCKRVGQSSVKTLTAILEYFCQEILNSSAREAGKESRKRIKVSDVQGAVKKDRELFQVFGSGIFSGR
ncbi:histone H2A domain-containing protein [Brazilian marseillevirus]|uniref:histone H2A domain-containing protein n=1 Tax=Brazilian marseillevirus TaxID=1813599 RepID=UPI000785E07B|nr:histone H2A domain-containing protein [Brazilian marseillevirus]AMQ10667.1 histone H2A domain-containing protein [Brazilian marseillevirus]